VAIALEQPASAPLAAPPTIQALLAARLDRLAADERSVLERAAVAGRDFSRAEVEALSPDEAVEPRLEALARRELIVPLGPAAYRFGHALIREAAYAAIPKRERAALHERFAGYLERVRPDLDEVVGYHVEQAYLYRAELGDASGELALRAAGLLAAAGRRAYARDDLPAAVSLMSRAAGLLEEDDPARLELLPDLGEAVRESGDYRRGELVLAEAIDAAAEAGDRSLEEYARLVRLRMRVQTDEHLSADSLLAEATRLIGVFEELDDEGALAKAWELLAWARWIGCHAQATEEALLRSIEHAGRAGDRRTEAQSLHLLLGATLFGPVPVPEAVRRCEEILARERSQLRVTASALRALAALTAMGGAFEDARRQMGLFHRIVDDLGLRVTAASAAETDGVVELLAGDPVAAERKLRAGYDELGAMGEAFTRWNLAALLAQALSAQGRFGEAVAVAELAGPAPADDVSAQVHLKTALTTALAGVGRLEEAERNGRQAVELAGTTDFPVMRADALASLAGVLRRAGRAEEAAPLAAEALALYERKGSTVAAGALRETLGGTPQLL
jgi:predicted ATPase